MSFSMNLGSTLTCWVEYLTLIWIDIGGCDKPLGQHILLVHVRLKNYAPHWYLTVEISADHTGPRNKSDMVFEFKGM